MQSIYTKFKSEIGEARAYGFIFEKHGATLQDKSVWGYTNGGRTTSVSAVFV